jgi:hypothetical protein
MVMDLSSQQRALAERMSDISEDAYCAGWMIDLEYDLWQIVVAGHGSYGAVSLDDAEVGELRDLSAACGGWIIFERDKGEVFVPLAKWQELFAQRPSR